MINKNELSVILIDRYNSIISDYKKSPASLRFNRYFVTISDIEDQHYCERKVHLSYSREINSQIEAIKNKPAVEQTSQEKLLLKDLAKSKVREDIGALRHDSIISKGEGFSELQVVSLFDNIGIIGRLDRLSINSDLNNLLIIERKFRDKNSLPKDIRDSNFNLIHKASPYPEHRTQARAYCYSIKYMLQNTKYSELNLMYSVRYYLKELKDSFNEDFDNPLQEYIFNYDNNELLHGAAELNFASSYWLLERDSKPCSKKAYKKGLDCEYKLFCNECGWKENINGVINVC